MLQIIIFFVKNSRTIVWLQHLKHVRVMIANHLYIGKFTFHVMSDRSDINPQMQISSDYEILK